MKIIFGAFVTIGIISNFIYKKYNINVNNKLLEVFLKGVMGIIFYLIIFIPVYKLIGENMIISIGLMLITYIVMEILGYFILRYKELDLGWFSVLLIVGMYVVFGYLTYKSIHNFVFYDKSYKEYGILSKNK